MREIPIAFGEHFALFIVWAFSLLVFVLADGHPKPREVARLLFLATSIAIFVRAF